MAKSANKGKKKLLESKKTFGKSNYSFKEKVLGFIELARPMEWSKSLLNMTVAIFIAFYVYGAGVGLWTFVLGFFSVALLWSGLYALNDYTDWRIDFLHKIKKARAIPSGRVSPLQGLSYSVVLIIASYLIAFFLNNFLLAVCLTAMFVNQLLYTTKPFRLKSRKGFDMVSGSMVNPFFRYLSGLVLFVPPVAFFSAIPPLLPFLFVISIQFSGYSLYRLFSKDHDKKVNMKSTVAMVSEQKIKFYSYLLILVAVVSYLGLFVNWVTLKLDWLGYLPLQYLYPIVVALCFLPLMKEAILDPIKANLKSQYRILYVMTMVFILGNLVVFIFFR